MALLKMFRCDLCGTTGEPGPSAGSSLWMAYSFIEAKDELRYAIATQEEIEAATNRMISGHACPICWEKVKSVMLAIKKRAIDGDDGG